MRENKVVTEKIKLYTVKIKLVTECGYAYMKSP